MVELRYDLSHKRYRPGLTARDYRGRPLHETINRIYPPSINSHEMPPKKSGGAGTKALSKISAQASLKEEKAFDAPPESSSDEDDSADIKPSLLSKSRKSPTPEVRVRNGKKLGATVNSLATRSTRTTKETSSPSSSSGSNPTKRKPSALAADGFQGRTMMDPFGRVVAKKAKTSASKASTTYGSSQRSTVGGSQRSLSSSQASAKAKKPPGSPKSLGFQPVEDLDLGSSPKKSPAKQALKMPDSVESSPEKPSLKRNSTIGKLAVPASFEDPSMCTQAAVGSVFQLPEAADSFSGSVHKGSQSCTDPTNLDDTPGSTQSSLRDLIRRSPGYVAPKRDPKKPLDLQNYGLDRDLTSRLQKIVGKQELGVDATDMFDDLDTSLGVEARCPLCKQPCSVSELKKMGTMNTRKQEKFCRSHRKTSAKKRWDSKGYPEIDWENLESRIQEHHAFIKNILDGAESHYRDAFEKLVADGKGRSLKKADSNPTPGYYGSRGLDIISKHIIRDFAKPLSERSVNDGLISKRGITSFVQLVIVPEIIARLIMADMSIGEDEAREVLAESTDIGELIHEDVKDVVLDRAEETDEDGENERLALPTATT